jgi:hypothetical protein
VHVTEDSSPSLFFALRGAADSFGIVTTFYLQTHAAPSSIVFFTARIPAMLEDPNKAAHAFVKLQETVVDKNYDYINAAISFSVYINGKGAFTVRGWCIECDEMRFEEVVLPKLLEWFPKPSYQDVRKMGWIKSMYQNVPRRLGLG